MIVSLIAAMSKNRVIGVKGALPWHLPEDLKYFRDKTKGKAVVMGRKTFESIGSKPLPGRLNVVVTKQKDFRYEGVQVVHQLQDAIENLMRDPVYSQQEIFIIGGGEIYKASLPFADKIYLTEIDHEVSGGDAFFPEFSKDLFREQSRRVVTEPFAHAYVIYQKHSA